MVWCPKSGQSRNIDTCSMSTGLTRIQVQEPLCRRQWMRQRVQDSRSTIRVRRRTWDCFRVSADISGEVSLTSLDFYMVRTLFFAAMSQWISTNPTRTMLCPNYEIFLSDKISAITKGLISIFSCIPPNPPITGE
jgi:hypothetical protein